MDFVDKVMAAAHTAELSYAELIKKNREFIWLIRRRKNHVEIQEGDDHTSKDLDDDLASSDLRELVKLVKTASAGHGERDNYKRFIEHRRRLQAQAGKPEKDGGLDKTELAFSKKWAQKGSRDAQIVLNLLEKAEEGDADSQYKLAVMLEAGELGLKKDLGRALAWYYEAAEQGDARAQCAVGAMFQNGTAVEADSNRAKTWYQKAAENKNAPKEVEKSALEKAYQLEKAEKNGELSDLERWNNWYEDEERFVRYLRAAAERAPWVEGFSAATDYSLFRPDTDMGIENGPLERALMLDKATRDEYNWPNLPERIEFFLQAKATEQNEERPKVDRLLQTLTEHKKKLEHDGLAGLAFYTDSKFNETLEQTVAVLKEFYAREYDLAIYKWRCVVDRLTAEERVRRDASGRICGTINADPDTCWYDAVSVFNRYAEELFPLIVDVRLENARLEGHTDSVRSVAFSPDGGLLASGSGDKTIRLWDVDARQETARLEGHTAFVMSVAFSPDGGLLASGSGDKTIRLWDIEARQEIARLEGHTDSVSSVAFSPDGGLLASGSGDKTIWLWDIEALQETARLEGHTDSVRSVAFSPVGRLLASGSHDKTIRLWDIEARQEIARLEGHSDVTSVAFSPDGRLLASGGHETTLQLWDVDAHKEIARLEGYVDLVTSVAFSPDGRLLAVGGYETTLQLWDVEARQEIALLERRTNAGRWGPVSSVAFSPDGRLLASGDETKKIGLWLAGQLQVE